MYVFIVPVEAMHARCPVIAVDSGGPRETVVDGVTGFLCPGSPAEFAGAMSKLIGGGAEGIDLRRQMGDAGRQRVLECFSFDSFTDKLDDIIRTVCS